MKRVDKTVAAVKLVRPGCVWVACVLLFGAPLWARAQAIAYSPQAFMPRVPDYTLMWWAEGFPGHTHAAPWRRVVQTGCDAFVLDTDTLRLYVNGEPSRERKIGRPRVAGRHGFAIGRRQDNDGDGCHFRGVVDEIRIYDRARASSEIRERFSL